MVFASVNGDTPRHFNSHLTLRISATEKVGPAPKHCCDCPLLWYNFIALLVFSAVTALVL
jgi:hypothetical protein